MPAQMAAATASAEEPPKPVQAHALVESSDEEADEEERSAAGAVDEGPPQRPASSDGAAHRPASHGAAPVDEDQRACVREMGSGPLPHSARLCVSEGSVLDFGHRTRWSRDTTAVVNAANTGGIGGGGVDAAFKKRGGRALKRDRQALQFLTDSAGGGIGDRIPEGGARATGPNNYGTLYAKTVIHAVGPRYPDHVDDFQEEDETLRRAYLETMQVAQKRKIEYLGFSLLSAGIYGGAQELETILRIGLDTIAANSYEGLREVHMVGFSHREQECLKHLLLERPDATLTSLKPEPVKRKRREQAEQAAADLSPKHAAQRQLNSGARDTPDVPTQSAARAPSACVLPTPEVRSVGQQQPQQPSLAPAAGKTNRLKLNRTTPEQRRPQQQQQRQAGDPYAFDESSSGPSQKSQKQRHSTEAAKTAANAASVSAPQSSKRQGKPAAQGKDKKKAGTKRSKNGAKAQNKLQKLAMEKGQQRLAFAAPLKEGDAPELVTASRHEVPLNTSKGTTSKNNTAFSQPSLDDLLQQKRAKQEAADQRRAAIEKETQAMVPAGYSAELLAELDDNDSERDELSDIDSDLDGGDDSELSETDVWLGTFEVQRTGEWRKGEISMNEALLEKKKRLGKLHKWRMGHFTAQLRRGSGKGAGDGQKFVSQRDVVMALMDKRSASALLSRVERLEMAQEFVMLQEAVLAYQKRKEDPPAAPSGGGVGGAAAL